MQVNPTINRMVMLANRTLERDLKEFLGLDSKLHRQLGQHLTGISVHLRPSHR